MNQFAIQGRQIDQALQKNKNLGFSDVRKMQGSTRVIFQRKTLTAGRTFIEFFTDLGNTPINNRSIDDNKLSAGETIVIKEILLQNFTETLDPQTFGNALINVFIGSQVVYKDIPLSELYPGTGYNNIKSNFDSTFNDFTNLSARLITNIIIPPQVEFKVTIDFPFVNSNNQDFGLHLKGYGKLINLNQF